MTLDIVRAQNLREAALLSAEDGSHLLAGGTILVRVARTGGFPVKRMILTDGLSLDTISVDGGTVEIGAAVTMTGIASDPRLAFLKKAAESIGGPAVRNMATVGGNLFARYPYGDFAVALLALDAEVITGDGEGSTTVPLESFLSAPPRRGVVVHSVRFAAPSANAFRFAKVTRKHPHGASVLSIAARLAEEDGRLSAPRVAYGAMSERPMRSKAVESVLEGRPLDAESVAEAVNVATEGCSPLTDPQASAWYRMAILPVHLGRLLSNEGTM